MMPQEAGAGLSAHSTQLVCRDRWALKPAHPSNGETGVEKWRIRTSRSASAPCDDLGYVTLSQKKEYKMPKTLCFKTMSLIAHASLKLLPQHPECWEAWHSCCHVSSSLPNRCSKSVPAEVSKNVLLPSAGSTLCAHFADGETEALRLTAISQGTGDT